MAKIITLDTSHRKRTTAKAAAKGSCPHKEVIAYTAHRTVRCAACGEVLDPFAVLVDLIKGALPPDANREEQRLLREVTRRRTVRNKPAPEDDPKDPA